MAPAAAAPSAAVPTAASAATQASSNFFTGKKSLGSLFHVSVAFYMHLIKSPKRNSHCSPLQVKDTSNDVSGYAKFSNAQNASTICASTSSLHTSSTRRLCTRQRLRRRTSACAQRATRPAQRLTTHCWSAWHSVKRRTTACGALASTTCRGAGCAHRA
jgi:hypothetical protein